MGMAYLRSFAACGGSAAPGAATAGDRAPLGLVCAWAAILWRGQTPHKEPFALSEVLARQPLESCGQDDHPKPRIEKGKGTGVEGPRFL